MRCGDAELRMPGLTGLETLRGEASKPRAIHAGDCTETDMPSWICASH